MTAPHFTELNHANAKAYAEYVAWVFTTGLAGDGTWMGDHFEFPLADGTSCDVWLECGRVYGEA